MNDNEHSNYFRTNKENIKKKLISLLNKYKSLSFSIQKKEQELIKTKLEAQKVFSHIYLNYNDILEIKPQSLGENIHYGSGYKRIKLIKLGIYPTREQEKYLPYKNIPLGFKIRRKYQKKTDNKENTIYFLEFTEKGLVIESEDNNNRWTDYEKFKNEIGCTETLEQFCGLTLGSIKKLVNELKSYQ